MTRSKILLLSALANLGLLACNAQPVDLAPSDDKSDTLSEAGDLVRFEIEVVGEGEVAILEPYVETCTTEDGICTFVFERGTRVVFEAEVVLETDPGRPILDCGGERICFVDLDQDRSVLADFEFTGHRIEGHRDFGRLPGQPWTIVDPIHDDEAAERSFVGATEGLIED